MAKLANVSRATVSRVLNNPTTVSPDALVRVEDAMSVLGYEPNVAARNLVRRDSRTIIFSSFSRDSWNLSSIADPGWHFYLSVLGEIEHRTKSAGYDLLLPSYPRDDTGGAFIRSLHARHVAGVIVSGVTSSDSRLPALLEARIPAVFIDLDVVGSHATSIRSDNTHGAETVMTHLLDLGHRNILILTGQPNELATAERLDGNQRAALGLADAVHLLPRSCGAWTLQAGYTATAQAMKDGLSFSAVVAHSDMLALGAMHALHERGLRVPEDVSVVGFDDVALAEYTNPPLTTMRQDAPLLGKAAVESLLQIIVHGTAPAPVRIPTTLSVRQSTGPVTIVNGQRLR